MNIYFYSLPLYARSSLLNTELLPFYFFKILFLSNLYTQSSLWPVSNMNSEFTATCQELLDKVMETPQLTEVLRMVLEEDGTSMESKDFFQLLEDDTCLMVLDFGKSWTPEGMGAVKWPRPGEHQAQKGHHPHHLQHIEAKPLELLWQPNIKATFYKLYPMSCDSQGPGLKKVLSLGQMLLGISSTLHHAVEGAKQWEQQQQEGGLHPY
uniref:CIDE-N domain-containing protein n=1 Tax=Ursus americanus TaxID=9643 RepID=A0A452SKX9_URSAM